jgi:Mycobacterium membrane protein
MARPENRDAASHVDLAANGNAAGWSVAQADQYDAGLRFPAPPAVAATRPDHRSSKPPRAERFSIVRIAKRLWILLVILAVVAIGGFGVYRLHGVFGSHNELTRPGAGLVNDPKPFNPKRVTYEIFGPPGAVATINYLDLDAQPQEVKDVTLPWSLTLTTTAPAASPNIVAQGNSDSIGCRITVNGEVRDENSSNGVNAQTFCLVKSA